MIKKKKFKLINSLIFFFLFSLAFFLTEKYSQSFHFVDEADHLVIASFMNKGYKLYSGLSTNHQPLVYILSSFAQKISQPNSLFMLIKRGKEAVFFFSFVSSLLLILSIGPIFLIFIFFFEMTKFFLFGNLLLAESLVIYPLIFIIHQSFKVIFYKFKPEKWSQAVFGLANFFIIFNVLPVIPSLLILDIIYLMKIKKIKHFSLGLILPIVILFLLIPVSDYLRETVVYNLKYAIPLISPIKEKKEILQLIIFPFKFFFKFKDSILHQLIRFISLFIMINFLVFLTTKKTKKIMSWLFFLLIILMLNTRNINVKEVYYYNGFHLLPWYAGLIFFNLLTAQYIIKKIDGLKKFLPCLLLFGGGVYFLLHPHMPYFTKINKNDEHNVNYLSYYLVGQAISVVSQPEERLAVLPDESLIYWQAGLKPATRQIAYYDWQYYAPELKKELDKVFSANPPEYIYADFKRIGPSNYLPALTMTLAKNYWQVTSQGVAQNLYIRKSKIKNITEGQWQAWQQLSFDKITL